MFRAFSIVFVSVLFSPTGINAQGLEPQPGSPNAASKDGNKKTDEQKPATVKNRLEDAWTMFRGNPLGTGYSNTKLPNELDLLWTFKVPQGAFESTAAIVNEVVYISDLDGKVYALDLTTGKKNWEYKVDSGFSASPAVRDGLIFVGDYDGTFYCIDLQGKLKWK
ncbi:MAG: PQQ-binding-like beta-propeller repeat protein, partial [Planctomycetota bacterium]|nr:PQQ-binding-like beta-propeller repeat protein [Planctomycetota bacterium]